MTNLPDAKNLLKSVGYGTEVARLGTPFPEYSTHKCMARPIQPVRLAVAGEAIGVPQ
jgi:hypothetical protein